MCWTSSEQEKLNQKEYEDMLIKRYQSGMYMTKADKKEARKLIALRNEGK